jgi:alpha-tubulin suppressor-like RCC1 family protein
MQTMVKSLCLWVGVLLAGAACHSPAVAPIGDGGNGDLLDADAGSGDLLDADAGFGDLFDVLPEDCESDDALPASCEDLGYSFGGVLQYTQDCRVDERRCRRIVSIAAGAYHTCAVLADGRLLCWGESGSGQLGNGVNSYEPVPEPQEVVGLTGVVQVACTEHRTCALTRDGQMYCWGMNIYGTLGSGTTESYEFSPVLVPDLSDVVGLTLGDWHTCAVLRDGTVRCWGKNGMGSLGDGTREDSTTPVTVQGITTAVFIEAALGHTCAILADKTVRCWGRNVTGTLGDGTTTERPSPVVAENLSGVVSLSAWGLNNVAVVEDGRAFAWGGYDEVMVPGELTGYVTIPLENPYIREAAGVATGWHHACILKIDGTVGCWGRNYEGQLGTGSLSDMPAPVTVEGISEAEMIASGRSHICALVQQGKKILCWGLGDDGQLGKKFFEFPHDASPLEIVP